MYLLPYCITCVVCEDYLTCDIAFNAVMPLSRASRRGRYSRIEGVVLGLLTQLGQAQSVGGEAQAGGDGP